MNIDLVIVLTSLVTFIFFVIGLTALVRIRGQEGILSSIKNVFLVLSLGSSVIFWIVVGDVILLIVHIVIFWALSFSYVLGLFGLPLTSLRIQLLLAIVASGDKGCYMKTLLKKYSKEAIVRQRLYRLETSGEIVEKGKYYMLRSRWSYFVLHNYFLLFLLKLYRPIKK